ncbi:(deoxy)nucleoside triphosphate pyrophosphohydrolase [Sporosarcina sp. Te-1]|uniref:(deoxy)nucleoside triphosphate pyrophosphohydrolase n=1 Tax=Sporosarcina sp. Te-1 TaxID=2818390 RepID=UPI001A9FC62E|nr:(deoxy)nucleoside triphosphate pyrophosphohydrolase [Sporosarcina sp. Te-1]QTD39471.1 (deoxy)nucleoside triphosphate pyrophosphohydrolase [Sporosarcina sp. Te-1]
MKSPLHVVGAIIHKEQGEILCARRSSKMTLPGFWEFPGGKVERGETPQEALVREIQEELGCYIRVGSFVDDTLYSYETLTIRLETYFAEIEAGTAVATEHSELRWVLWNELQSLEWAPADIPAVEKVVHQHGTNGSTVN